VLHETSTVPELQQLTLWPDDALPGQMPLFGRTAEVGWSPPTACDCSVPCEAAEVLHLPDIPCFHCEDITAVHLAGRGAFVNISRPAVEPIWEPTEWFGKRPPMVLVPAARCYL